MINIVWLTAPALLGCGRMVKIVWLIAPALLGDQSTMNEGSS